MSILSRALTIGFVSTIAMAGSTIAVFAQSPAADEILGVWESDSRDLKLEMYKSGGGYSGRVLFGNRLVEADGITWKIDAKNPNPALRHRSLAGIDMVSGLQWTAQKSWAGGSLYDASSGRTYNARVTMNGSTLELRGYVGTPALGRTVKMHRTAH